MSLDGVEDGASAKDALSEVVDAAATPGRRTEVAPARGRFILSHADHLDLSLSRPNGRELVGKMIRRRRI